MGRVQGLIALITGAAKGMGQAEAELFAQEGATIILTDVDAANGRATAEAIGGSAIFLHQDVSSPERWREVIGEIKSRFGRLDILVNNAGILQVGNVETETLENYRRAHSIMAEGVFLGCQAAIPLMAASGGGSIVNISSMAGIDGYGFLLAYSAAKGAVRAMTKSIAMHCQDQGYKIRCNSVHPGGIDTPMLRQNRPGAEPLVIPDGVLPFGSPGTAKDVAQMVLYLASPESRFVTAAEFVIDNGVMWRQAMPAR